MEKPKDENNVNDLLKLLIPTNNTLNTNQQKNNMAEMAEYYIKSGISVIPVGKNKIPLMPWKDYQNKYATKAEVAEWLERFPNMQLGIVTGKISNLIVVDVEKGGDFSWLPVTAISKTGGEGRHFYYSYVPGVSNKARIRELVDLRGDGGYVMAPPSISDKGSYEWLNKVQPVLFPKYLFEERPKTVIIPEYAQPAPGVFNGVSQGSRNNSLTSYVGYVLKSVHPSEWDTLAWQQIVAANVKNQPPLPERELRIIFESIKGAEKRANQYRYQQREAPDPSTLWDNENDQVMQFAEVVDAQNYNIFEKIKTGIEVFDEALAGGLNEGDLVVVSAPTSFGKTTFGQTLTYYFVQQVFPTLWFSYEVLHQYLWEKFQAMGMDREWFLYTPFKNVTGDVRWIEKKIKEAKEKFMTRVVVIDHLGFLLPGARTESKSNYSAWLGQICRELKTIALQERVIIVLMAHMRKTEEPTINDIRDSSGVAQEADVVFTMNREINPEEDGTEYYTPYTQIVMAKNRKTGKSVRAWFTINETQKFDYVEGYVPFKRKRKPKVILKNQFGKDD